MKALQQVLQKTLSIVKNIVKYESIAKFWVAVFFSAVVFFTEF